MAYRKIAKKFNLPEMASDIKNFLLYSEDADPAALNRIAEIMKVKKRTLYDYLDGRIKLDLDFLHAAVMATDGHPEITQYLEPDKFKLRKIDDQCVPDKETLSEECLDEYPAVAEFHRRILDPEAKDYQCQMAMNEAIHEMQQTLQKRRLDHR